MLVPTRVYDKILYVAAEALAHFVTDEELQEGKLFPPLSKIRDVSRRVAVAVIEQARKMNDVTSDDLDAFVHKKMYDPVYVPLVETREVTI